jgi:hypothetical protein
MTQDGLMPSQFQGDVGGVGALPQNRVECENILYQEMTPQRHHLPVRLKQAHLNDIRLEEPTLADYDAFVIKRTRP